MNQQNIMPNQYDIEKLRSKSIRIHNPISNIGFSVKVNSKKFPIDFFEKQKKKANKIGLLYSEKISRTEANTSRNKNEQLFDSPKGQSFPEAQVTSFFKVCYDSTNTRDTNPSQNKNASNETNIQVSQFNCFLHKQISSSVQLNEKNQILNQLCCTFSKIPVSESNIGTPQKKESQNQIISSSDQKILLSAFQRPLTKNQLRNRNIKKIRKSSMDKIQMRRNNQKNQMHNGSAQKITKKYTHNQFLLPPIPKHK